MRDCRKRVFVFLFSLGLAAGLACAPADRDPTSRPPNILIYLVDALRADRLGCYGYERPVSPHIDAFAASAVVFENAVAQSPWTRPSVASLLTGLLPATHGVQDLPHKLSEELVSLAEILGRAGYESAGFVTNPNVAGRFGFRQGFDSYRLLESRRSRARHLNEEVARWLRGRRTEVPFFLYLHAVDPHSPYQAPKKFRNRFAKEARGLAPSSGSLLEQLADGTIAATDENARRLSALYDAEVAANDAAFGHLLDILRRHDAYEDTVIVFISDHGEEFLEHGRWEHTKTLYTEVIDVPLIIRFPGVPARRVSLPAQHVDVLPTLLAYAGLETPAGVEGRDLLSIPEAQEADRLVISSVARRNVRGRSVTTRRYRLIVPDSGAFGPGPELYDRLADPAELHNIASDQPATAERLRTALDALTRDGGTAAPRIDDAELDPDLVERLRALGYGE